MDTSSASASVLPADIWFVVLEFDPPVGRWIGVDLLRVSRACLQAVRRSGLKTTAAQMWAAEQWTRWARRPPSRPSIPRGLFRTSPPNVGARIVEMSSDKRALLLKAVGVDALDLVRFADCGDATWVLLLLTEARKNGAARCAAWLEAMVLVACPTEDNVAILWAASGVLPRDMSDEQLLQYSYWLPLSRNVGATRRFLHDDRWVRRTLQAMEAVGPMRDPLSLVAGWAPVDVVLLACSVCNSRHVRRSGLVIVDADKNPDPEVLPTVLKHVDFAVTDEAFVGTIAECWNSPHMHLLSGMASAHPHMFFAKAIENHGMDISAAREVSRKFSIPFELRDVAPYVNFQSMVSFPELREDNDRGIWGRVAEKISSGKGHLTSFMLHHLVACIDDGFLCARMIDQPRLNWLGSESLLVAAACTQCAELFTVVARRTSYAERTAASACILVDVPRMSHPMRSTVLFYTRERRTD